MKVPVGLLGCGAMGSELARALLQERVPGGELVAVFDEDANRAADLAGRHPGAIVVASEVRDLIDAVLTSGASSEGASPALGEDEPAGEGSRRPIIVESASQAAARAHALSVVEGGCSLLLMSSGALLDAGLFDRLTRAAADRGSQLLVPSGAVGGTDALRACRGLLQEVTITSTKPPGSLEGAPGFDAWRGHEFAAATVIFEGSAREAVKLFPANVNVAATVSLAGLGPDDTHVKVLADPAASGNTHEISASGRFGILSFRFENEPHPDNPKTSYLAALAAIEALRGYCDPTIRVGT